MKSILVKSFKKAHVIGMFVLSVWPACKIQVSAMLRMQEFAKSMAALKDQTTEWGAPQINGIDEVGNGLMKARPK